jgi:hypothetical protein
VAEVVEIIKASSESEAIEQIASLYPTMVDYQIESRRNERGQFSKHGHTFMIRVQFEEPDEPAPEELGEDEY